MAKRYLTHTWTNPALYVAQSKIDAKGIFTGSTIKAGEKVMEFGGIIFNKKDFDGNKVRIMTLFPISNNTYLGLPATDKSESIDEYLNHSCDPNTWMSNDVTIRARRDINRGEEITLDCATWDADTAWTYTDDGKCYCGTQICRKILSPDDWKNEEIQKKYKGHFAPYIQKKIERLKKSE